MKTIWIARPKTVEAIMFTGENFDEICEFTGDLFYKNHGKFVLKCRCPITYEPWERQVKDGDWIVNCANDTKYPFKVMDGNTLNARYTPIARGKASEIECDFYNQTMLDMSRICD